jgi:hypothetical protein
MNECCEIGPWIFLHIIVGENINTLPTMLICDIFTVVGNIGSETRSAICEYALLKLRMLNSVHKIGCRTTELSLERKMFPVCGPGKYICISVVFRYLRNFRNFIRDISWKFLALSLLPIRFPPWANEKIPYGARKNVPVTTRDYSSLRTAKLR